MIKTLYVYRFRARFSGHVASVVASEHTEAATKAEIWFECIDGISPNLSHLIDKVNQIPISLAG